MSPTTASSSTPGSSNSNVMIVIIILCVVVVCGVGASDPTYTEVREGGNAIELKKNAAYSTHGGAESALSAGGEPVDAGQGSYLH